MRNEKKIANRRKQKDDHFQSNTKCNNKETFSLFSAILSLCLKFSSEEKNLFHAHTSTTQQKIVLLPHTLPILLSCLLYIFASKTRTRHNVFLFHIEYCICFNVGCIDASFLCFLFFFSIIFVAILPKSKYTIVELFCLFDNS